MWQPLRIGYTLLLLIALLPALFARAETESTPDSEFPPAIAELTLESHGYRLPALIYLANGKGPHPTLVLLHGFPGNEKNLDIAQSLRRDGFNVLFFHYRGAWGAEGDYSIISQPQDVASALAFLRSPDNAEQFRVDTNKLSLLGHSMGGYSALAAGSRDSDLVCVGAMSPGNVGQFKLAIEDGQPSGEWLLNYADSLFMLRGFSGEKSQRGQRHRDTSRCHVHALGGSLPARSRAQSRRARYQRRSLVFLEPAKIDRTDTGLDASGMSLVLGGTKAITRARDAARIGFFATRYRFPPVHGEFAIWASTGCW